MMEKEQVCENVVPVGEENSTETRFLCIILKFKTGCSFFLKKRATLRMAQWGGNVRLGQWFNSKLNNLGSKYNVTLT